MIWLLGLAFALQTVGAIVVLAWFLKTANRRDW